MSPAMNWYHHISVNKRALGLAKLAIQCAPGKFRFVGAKIREQLYPEKRQLTVNQLRKTGKPFNKYRQI